MKISIKRYTLRGDTHKLEEFNSGKYARTNYKNLYKLEMMRKDDTLFLLATPSLSLVLHSIRALWNAKDGDPFDRRDHPAILQAFFADPKVDEAIEQYEKMNREQKRALKKGKNAKSTTKKAKTAAA